jgi:cobaltochelatase CobS
MNYKDMNRKELKSELRKQGIKFKNSAVAKKVGKSEAVKLLEAATIHGAGHQIVIDMIAEITARIESNVGTIPAPTKPEPVIPAPAKPEPVEPKKEPVEPKIEPKKEPAKPEPVSNPITPDTLKTGDALTDAILTHVAPVLLKYIDEKMGSGNIEDKLRELVEQAATKHRKIIDVNITAPTVKGKPVTIKNAHSEFADVFDYVMETPIGGIMLVGPTASGKTTLVEQIWEACKGTFFSCYSPVPLGPESGPADLVGYMDGNGNYVEGAMYKPFTEGGLVLLDEKDNAATDAMTQMNALIENKLVRFPNGLKERHPNFRVIATANTWGTGADCDFSGRQPLDAATRSRYSFYFLDYDEDFEREITQDDVWVDLVQEYRRVVRNLKVRLHVTPRACLRGTTYLSSLPKKLIRKHGKNLSDAQINAGINHIEDMLIWQGADKGIIERVKGNVADSYGRAVFNSVKEAIKKATA